MSRVDDDSTADGLGPAHDTDDVGPAGTGPPGTGGDLGGDGLDGAGPGGPRRRRTAVLAAGVTAVLALGFVWVLGTSEPGTDREAQSPLLGKVAPPLAGTTLDGGQFDIADHRGQWVVVNVFATWCGPCRQEHPELVAFDEKHREARDVALVSVLFDDRPSTARRFFERNGGEWPVVVDADARIATDYGVAQVPETYVVAPDGQVVAKLLGGVTLDGLEGVIADVRSGPPPGEGS